MSHVNIDLVLVLLWRGKKGGKKTLQLCACKKKTNDCKPFGSGTLKARYVSTNCLNVSGGWRPGNIPQGARMGRGGGGKLSYLNFNIKSSLSGNKHKKYPANKRKKPIWNGLKRDSGKGNGPLMASTKCSTDHNLPKQSSHFQRGVREILTNVERWGK